MQALLLCGFSVYRDFLCVVCWVFLYDGRYLLFFVDAMSVKYKFKTTWFRRKCAYYKIQNRENFYGSNIFVHHYVEVFVSAPPPYSPDERIDSMF